MILEILFVFISKLYIKFSNRENDWYYLPIVVISFLISFNLQIIAALFINLHPAILIIVIIISFFILIFYFQKFRDNKSEIINYNLTKWNYIFVCIFLILDFILLRYIINYARSLNIVN